MLEARRIGNRDRELGVHENFERFNADRGNGNSDRKIEISSAASGPARFLDELNVET